MPRPAFQLRTPNPCLSFYVCFPSSPQHPSRMRPRTRLSPFAPVLHSRHTKRCASCGCVILSRALTTLQEAFPRLGEMVTQTLVFLEGSSSSQNILFPPRDDPACAACSSTLLCSLVTFVCSNSLFVIRSLMQRFNSAGLRFLKSVIGRL